ncbi:muramidase (phage lysozyme) [Pseudomonas sp. ADAK2 TE3594]
MLFIQPTAHNLPQTKEQVSLFLCSQRGRQRASKSILVTFIMAEVVSKNGRKMSPVATRAVTPVKDATPKTVSLDARKQIRRAENEEYLKDKNVKAFLVAIAESEGGSYHAKYGYGWAPGFQSGKWTFTDESTHPGAGYGGKTTASGMYQITIATWREYAGKMGLTDFTPNTQDLIAVDILRTLGVIDKIKAGDIPGAMPKAATRWAALPEGPGKKNHYPPQPYAEYPKFLESYKSAGGTVK